MKNYNNYKIFFKIIILLLLLIYIIYILNNFFNVKIEFFNSKEDFIIQSEGMGYEWGGYKLKHIFEYVFNNKNIIIDLENKYKPDLVIKSHFGNREYNCPYICWSGEAYRAQHKSYPPLCEINTIIINDQNIKSFYIPYGLWSEYTYDKFQDRDTIDNFNSKKYDFGYIASNCGQSIREDLFREIRNIYLQNDNNNIDKIRSLGSCQHTHDDLKNYDREEWRSNDKIYRDYKFVFCSENQDLDGYITEKIFLGFLGKSIPIYYGTSRIKEYFNDKAFFYINDYLNDNKTIADIANILKNLAADDSENGWKKYLREPVFHNNIEPELFKVVQSPISSYGKEIGDFIRENYTYNKEK